MVMGPWVAGFDDVERAACDEARCTGWIALVYVYIAYTNIEGNDDGQAHALRYRTPKVNPYLRALARGLDNITKTVSGKTNLDRET